MKVLIFEQFSGGHYTNYCRHLIEKFANEPQVDTIQLATTEKHLQHPDLKGYLEQYAAKITFVKLPDNVGPTGSRNDRRTIFNNLVQVLKDHQTDVLISTTADFLSTSSALLSLVGYNPLKKINSIGLFHYGYGKELSGKKDGIKRLIYNLTYRFSGWKHKLFVNPVVYENISLQPNMDLVSDPVEVNKIYPQGEARGKLGLDPRDKIIGYIGNIDKRKALLEFLEGFFSRTSAAPEEKVLLMGRLDGDYKTFIGEHYAQELKEGRIIMIDRHLSFDEIELGLAACDVVSVLYHDAPGLSANMLYAVCSGKRVIANSFGYTGMMLSRFNLGSKCRPGDKVSIQKAISEELALAAQGTSHAPSEKIRSFYQVQNFQNLIANLALGLNQPVIRWKDIQN